jgi:hypothetical protein
MAVNTGYSIVSLHHRKAITNCHVVLWVIRLHGQTRVYYNCNKKKLFKLNSGVMDDNYDTYTTANIEINQLFLESLINYLIFFQLHHTCEIFIFDRVTRNELTYQHFESVKSFIYVSVHFCE